MKKLLAAVAIAAVSMMFSAKAETEELPVPVATTFQQTSDIGSGSGYKGDLQNPEWWSAGVPQGIGWAATFLLGRDSADKTSYITNSAPLCLEHMTASCKDFYIRSTNPFVFSSPSNSIVRCASGGMKLICPVVFNSPVSWLSTYPLQFRGETTFNDGLYLPGLLIANNDGGCGKITIAGDFSGIPDADNSSGGHVALAAGGTEITVSNTANFAGNWDVKNGTVKVTEGDAFWTANYADVEAGVPQEGLILHMDAADESTITFADGNRIAEWRSKVGGHAAVPKRGDGYRPTWRERELGVLPVVDMATGIDSQGFPLKFGTSVSGAKTVFMVIGSENGGGWLWGSDNSAKRSLHRGGGCGGNVVADPWATRTYGVNDALGWRNGRVFNVYAAAPGGGYELLCLEREGDEAFYPIAGFAFDHLESDSRQGYQKLAEFIAYDVKLGEADRKKVEKYLREKWLRGTTDFRYMVGVTRSVLDVAEPAEDGHVTHVAHFSGRSALAKKGAGEIVLDRPRDLVNPLEVHGGTVAVESHDAGPRLDGVTAGVASDGLILHLDASVAGSLTLNGTLVTEWRDCRGGEFANKLVPGVDGTIVAKSPILRTKAAKNNLPVVDFGRLKGAAFMNLDTRITTARTVLMALNTRYGGGHILTDVSTKQLAGAGGTSYHRGNLNNLTAGLLIANVYDIESAWGSSANGNRVLQNLVRVKTHRKAPAGRPEVVVFNSSSNCKIGRIGQDRDMTERSGGLQVGELLVYGRQLTDAEIASAYKYLESKWIDYDEPELRTVVAKGSGALNAKVDFAVGTLGGSGTLAAKGGTVTVDGLSDFSGSLVSEGGTWNIRHDRGAVPTANPVTEGLLAHFDPSRSDLVTTDEGKITEMRAVNDATLTATPHPTAKAFATLREGDAEVNGLSVVDCGDAYSHKGLAWSTSFTEAQTVVCIYGAQGGGGQIFGSDTMDQAFQRNIGGVANPIFGSVQGGLMMGETYIDGVHTGYGEDGLKPGYQILSFVMPQRFAINWMGIRRIYQGQPDAGGQRYGETLVWNRALSDAERKSVEAYLAYKWFGKAIHGYTAEDVPNIPGQDTSAGAATYGIAAGETTSIGYLTGAGGLAKTGAGTLELKGSTSELTGGIDVREGVVKYTVTMLDPEVVPVKDGLVARFDPSVASTLTVEDGKVTKWAAAETGAGVGALTAYAIYPARAATLLEDELNGHPVVDTGAYGSTGQGFVCRSGDGSSDELDVSNMVQTVFMVLGSQNGGGFMLGALCGESWHRGSAKCLLTDAMYNGSAAGSGKISACCLDGVEFAPTAAMLSGGYQIAETHRGTAAWWAGFAFDRYSRRWNSSGFTDRSGGQRLGEILLYDRKLTADEIAAVRRYLWNRWYGRAYAGSGVLDTMYPNQAKAGAVTVASGATLDLNGFTLNCAALGGAGTVDGDLVVNEALEAVPGETLSVSGTVTFGESGRIEVPDDWPVHLGSYRIISATAVAGAENFRRWKTTIDRGGQTYRLWFSVRGGDVYLNVTGTGLILLLR